MGVMNTFCGRVETVEQTKQVIFLLFLLVGSMKERGAFLGILQDVVNTILGLQKVVQYKPKAIRG